MTQFHAAQWRAFFSCARSSRGGADLDGAKLDVEKF